LQIVPAGNTCPPLLDEELLLAAPELLLDEELVLVAPELLLDEELLLAAPELLDVELVLVAPELVELVVPLLELPELEEAPVAVPPAPPHAASACAARGIATKKQAVSAREVGFTRRS
jgi:hypothetical protein